MEEISKTIILLVLVYSTYTDIKTRKVMMIPILGCYFLALLEYFLPIGQNCVSIIGILPGIMLIPISIVSKGELGMGDVYLTIAIGLFMGIKGTLEILMIASGIAAVYSLIMLILKKVDRKTRMPFVPFILSGYLGILIIGHDFL